MPIADGTFEAVGQVSRPPVGCYVHVPFCVSVCPYCDFVVLGGAASRGPRARIGEWLLAVRRELGLRADRLDAAFGPAGSSEPALRPPLRSLYLGGGTPSLVDPGDVAGLIALVRERYGLAADAEVTIEANPGPDERGDAAALVAAGVTRISFGAQSLDPGELRRLGRRHAPGDVAAAVAGARAGGIGSIGLDLLYDVPGQTLASWERTLDAALALEPDHLSLYALTLDDPDAEGLTGPSGDHLPLRSGARRWRASAIGEQDEERAATAYRLASARLADAGWHGYEISNWARPGHESHHNRAYWRREPVAAAGPGAHGFDGATRWWNAARFDAWAGALAADRLPPGGAETVDPATALAEAVVLALRTDEGVPIATARAPRFSEAFEDAQVAGLVTIEGERVVLTLDGRLLGDELFRRLV